MSKKEDQLKLYIMDMKIRKKIMKEDYDNLFHIIDGKKIVSDEIIDLLRSKMMTKDELKKAGNFTEHTIRNKLRKHKENKTLNYKTRKVNNRLCKLWYVVGVRYE